MTSENVAVDIGLHWRLRWLRLA